MVQLATLQVVKRDGRREDFSREKLFAGFRRACTKLPIPVAELESMVDEIQSKIAADGRAEVPSSLVGELAMDALRKLDHIAYIRFASVYRSFSDIQTLKEAVEALELGRVQSAEAQSLQLSLIEETTDQEPPLLGQRARPATNAAGR